MNTKFKKFIEQFIKYFITGGIAAIVEWITFFVFNKTFSIHYLIAVIFSFLLATTINYLICIKYVFKKSKYQSSVEIFLIFIVSFIGLLMNLGLMYLFVSNLKVDAFASKIFSTGIVFFWNFILRKVWIFKS